ncbi:MAG: SIMPL domain-containing protein [Dehalococcoidales bacterium]|nr:SIMPL domain-containing protein [Dehalococcoidales bacterium]
MKRKWLLLAGLVLLVVAMVGLTSCEASPVSEGIAELNLSSQQQGIWVGGQGEVSAVPDIVSLSLGVEAQAATVAEAQAQANEAMDEVMAALAGNGIAEKDIQTQHFSIQRVTRWDNQKQEEVVTGYRVTNIVSAKIRKIDDAGSIIDAVAQAGGDLTRIDSINFSVEDPADYYEQAREEAMADAGAKAKQLADLAGVTLGKVTYISESSYAPPIVSRGVYAIPEAAQAETPISPGELEINVSIQAVYDIR